MSTLKVDKIDPQTGTALEIGSNNDVITVPSGAQLTIASGATIDVSGCTLTPPATMPASSGVNLTALNASNLTSGTVGASYFPSGSIVAVETFNSTTTIAVSSGTTTGLGYDTGFYIRHTPSHANNLMVLMVTMGTATSNSSDSIEFNIVQDSTQIGQGVASGNRQGTTYKSELSAQEEGNHGSGHAFVTTWTAGDTSQHDYKLYMRVQGGGLYINRTALDDNTSNTYSSRSQTTMVLYEIKA